MDVDVDVNTDAPMENNPLILRMNYIIVTDEL